MALFKKRKGDDDRVAAATQPESVEVMRRRAKHRLIGAGVLVLIAVVGFPLLFDTQPRPIAVDIPIVIPDRGKVQPLVIPPPPVAAVTQAPAASSPAPAAGSRVTTDASLDPKEQIVTQVPEPKPEAAKPGPGKPEAAPATKETEARPAPKMDDGARAKALLEGKSVAAATAATAVEGRFVVQIGAFAEPAKVQEVRRKVERAGLTTYTQVADTKDGKRTRVRVGPYASKAEAEKAAARIKGLDLPAAILTL